MLPTQPSAPSTPPTVGGAPEAVGGVHRSPEPDRSELLEQPGDKVVEIVRGGEVVEETQ